MMKTSTHDGPSKHSILLGLGATFLTGAVLYFNGSYGLTFSYGMAAAFIGFAIVKDAGISYAWAAHGQRGRVAAGLLGVIAFVISCLAAIGAASHGRQEANDPKSAQIARYDAAERQRSAAEKRLVELGRTPSAAEAEAKVSAMLAEVDRGIAKRTAACTVLAPEGNGPRQQAANREACQPVIDAKAFVVKAKEADDLRAKRDAADVVLAEGKPDSADAQATTLAALFSMFGALNGIAGIQAWTNLAIGLGLEIGSPLAWAAFAASLVPAASAKPELPNVPRNPTPVNPGIPANDWHSGNSIPGIPTPPAPPQPPKGGRRIPGNRGRKSDNRVVDFSERFREKHGRGPSGSEIRAAFPELPVSTAYDYAGRARQRA